MKQLTGTILIFLADFRRWAKYFMAATALIMVVFSGVGNADASFTWEGGDWGGRDFSPADGDILSGSFTDIGHFIINAGETVYAGSSTLSFATNDTVINGIFLGGSALAPSLDIKAQTNITLAGSLDQWSAVSLSSQVISLLAGSSVTASNSTTATGGTTGSTPSAGCITLNAGGSIFSTRQNIVPSVDLSISKDTPVFSGGSISLAPVPLPATFLLFAPGLAVAALARRKITG